ncbi:MAG TPA: TIGR00730 family Rossman fold protein [Gemmataceae bacterium]|nr:TIGR00730 family Rossman fold protein [Gemmataceae bacterium]
MRRLCVFCGSSPGQRPIHAESARSLGMIMAARGLALVYGGGHVGLMGVLADAVLEAGGEVIGVIPQSMVDKELAHTGISKLHIVGTMHERKALMADLADGFAALPGAFGTADELFEILTWAQLGLHAKPVGILNVDGFFQALLAWLDHAVAEGFLKPRHRQLLQEAGDAEKLVDLLISYRPEPVEGKWLERRDL